MSIQINSSIISGSVKFSTIYPGQSTGYAQNVAGTDSDTGFFFRPTVTSHPNFGDVQVGWYVTGQPTWIVTNAVMIPDPDDPVGIVPSYVITISAGTFLSGVSYAFTGV